ncbi:MAG: peptide deformylase [Actinobacteria bacterium]|nr:peptide deformylase [Actinomycetota bacterium]
MSPLPIREIGDPVLREVAEPVSLEELGRPETQELIEAMIETMREANGAGLAAPQVGVAKRIAVIEVRPGNPRYPYKPPVPLTVLVNPELEPLGAETYLSNEGCLSIPNLRGELERAAEVRARYLDRDGEVKDEIRRGLTAGTFQHEVDHLDGVLLVDRADPATFSTWEQFERFGKAEFVARATELTARLGA